jgi:hypothetical protein
MDCVHWWLNSYTTVQNTVSCREAILVANNGRNSFSLIDKGSRQQRAQTTRRRLRKVSDPRRQSDDRKTCRGLTNSVRGTPPGLAFGAATTSDIRVL